MHKLAHILRLGFKELTSLRHDSVLLLFLAYAFTRVGETNAAKRHLAQLAAERVEDGQIVLFDSGSTTLQIAQSLPRSIRLTVVTPSPMIAIALADHPEVKVILAGGQLNPATLSTSGHEAVRLIQSVKADLLFTGVCALHPQVGITSLHFDDLFDFHPQHFQPQLLVGLHTRHMPLGNQRVNTAARRHDQQNHGQTDPDILNFHASPPRSYGLGQASGVRVH